MSDLETIHTGFDFGEGPRWHDGRLWFSDFYRGGVFTLDADGTETRQATVEARPSGLGWMPDGTLLIVSMTDRLVLAMSPDGALRRHADLSAVASGDCNDMVVAADGTAYVGNFGSDIYADTTFSPADLARISPDGEVSVAAEDLLFPNGSVITPDGSTLIVGETFAGRYTAFDIADDGSLTNRRIWASVEGSTPDGCCLDAEGGIWMADVMNSRVARVVEGGEVTDEIETPGLAVCCALGSEDRLTLHIFISPGAAPEEVAGKGLSKIVTTRVEIPGAGLP